MQEKYYNAVVKLYNNKCEMFPTNILAGLFSTLIRNRCSK